MSNCFFVKWKIRRKQWLNLKLIRLLYYQLGSLKRHRLKTTQYNYKINKWIAKVALISLIDYLLQKIKLHSSFLYAFACFSNPNTARKIMNSILFQQGLWECMRVFFSYSQWKIETEFLFWLVSIWRPVNVKKELQFQVIAKLRKRQKMFICRNFKHLVEGNSFFTFYQLGGIIQL